MPLRIVNRSDYRNKNMPLRKISDPLPLPCNHPEHNPPGMMVLSPGTYEYTCPQCGNKQIFTVPQVYL